MNKLLGGCGLVLLSAMATRAGAQQPSCTFTPPLPPQRLLPPGGAVTVNANCTNLPFFCSACNPGWTANGAPVQSCNPSSSGQSLTQNISNTTTFALSVSN